MRKVERPGNWSTYNGIQIEKRKKNIIARLEVKNYTCYRQLMNCSWGFHKQWWKSFKLRQLNLHNTKPK